MKYTGYIFLLVALLFASCREDINDVVTTTTTEDPTIINAWEQTIQPIIGSLTGVVTKEDGELVTDAIVTLGSNTTTTDAYGHFFFYNVEMNKAGTYVTIEKEGFMHGSRRFFPQADAMARVEIELLNNSTDFNFSALEGGLYEPESMQGGKLEFPANAIVTEDGQLYSGEVNVAAKMLSMQAPSTYKRMPGNLQGVNLMASEVALKTLGMVAVELTSENGEKLNVAEGKTVKVSIKTDPDLASVIPAQVPMWSFNENVGMWVEETVANLEDEFYVAELPHFSFWNYDIPGDYVTIDMVIKDFAGVPMIFQEVRVTSSVYGTMSGYTDNDGYVGGLVPANEVLLVTMYGPCGETLFTGSFGPLSEDTFLGEFILPNTEFNNTTVSGVVTDCDGNIISNSLAIIENEIYSVYVYTAEDGSFNHTFQHCSDINDLEVTVVDLTSSTASTPISVQGNTSTNIGEVAACDVVLDIYINVTIDGVSKTYLPTGGQLGPSSSGAFSLIGDEIIGIYFEGTTVGNYAPDMAYIEIFEDPSMGWSMSNGSEVWTTFNVTQCDEEFIIADFSGTVSQMNPDGTSQEVTIEGDFKIIP